MSDVLDLLRAARERIAVPERWTQKTDARTATGRACGAYQKKAVAWCAFGSIFAASGATPNAAAPLVARAYRAVQAVLPDKGFGVTRYNDTHSHAEVLALFDRAIAALEAEEVSA